MYDSTNKTPPHRHEQKSQSRFNFHPILRTFECNRKEETSQI